MKRHIVLCILLGLMLVLGFMPVRAEANSGHHPVLPARFTPAVQKWSGPVYRNARRYGIPAAVVAAVIYTESRGNPHAVSDDGYSSIGLMQLLSSTATGIGCGNLWKAHLNIQCGTKYLALLRNQDAHGSMWLALAMYNGGPGNPAAGYGYANVVWRLAHAR
jgi:soluble lytic murein transglycosylase-like protein